MQIIQTIYYVNRYFLVIYNFISQARPRPQVFQPLPSIRGWLDSKTSKDSHCACPFGLMNHWKSLLSMDSHCTWPFWPGESMTRYDKQRFTLHLAFWPHELLISKDSHCAWPFGPWIIERKDSHCTWLFGLLNYWQTKIHIALCESMISNYPLTPGFRTCWPATHESRLMFLIPSFEWPYVKTYVAGGTDKY